MDGGRGGTRTPDLLRVKKPGILSTLFMLFLWLHSLTPIQRACFPATRNTFGCNTWTFGTLLDHRTMNTTRTILPYHETTIPQPKCTALCPNSGLRCPSCSASPVCFQPRRQPRYLSPHPPIPPYLDSPSPCPHR